MREGRIQDTPKKCHRHQFYLDPVLTRKLDHYAREKRASKSTLMTQALGALFKQLETAEVENVFAARLDRLLRHATNTDAKIDALTELVCVLTKFVTLTTTEVGMSDEAIHRKAEQRYQHLIDVVQRRITHGHHGLEVPKKTTNKIAQSPVNTAAE